MQTIDSARSGLNTAPNTNASTSTAHGGYMHMSNMIDTCHIGSMSLVSKDFDGTNPKTGGILSLGNKSITSKMCYDIFSEKL